MHWSELVTASNERDADIPFGESASLDSLDPPAALHLQQQKSSYDLWPDPPSDVYNILSS